MSDGIAAPLREILGVLVPTASAEDTIIAKLEWAKQGSSERQIRDVVGILRVRGEDIDRAYILRWVEALGLEEQWEGACALTEAASLAWAAYLNNSTDRAILRHPEMPIFGHNFLNLDEHPVHELTARERSIYIGGIPTVTISSSS